MRGRKIPDWKERGWYGSKTLEGSVEKKEVGRRHYPRKGWTRGTME